MISMFLPSSDISNQNSSYLLTIRSDALQNNSYYDQCINDTDCNGSLKCFPINASWIINSSNETIRFYQHDNIKGSDTYIQLIGKPQVNFCACPTLGAWTGYDCTDFHSSFYFEAFWLILAAIIYFSISFCGCADIYYQIKVLGIESLKNRLGFALFFNILASSFGFAGRVLYLYIIFHPNDFIIDNGSKGSRHIRTVTWFNYFGFILTMMSVLHIGSCWIEVSNDVQSFKKDGDKKFHVSMQRIVLFLEASLAFSLLILIVIGRVSLVFVLSFPWVIAILIMCSFGARRMMLLMNEVLERTTTIVTNASINDEYRTIMASIIKTANLLFLFVMISLTSNLIYFIYLTSNPAGSPGLWNRPNIWATHAIFAFGGVGILATTYMYIHPRLKYKRTARMRKSKIEVAKSEPSSQNLLKDSIRLPQPILSPKSSLKAIVSSPATDNNLAA